MALSTQDFTDHQLVQDAVAAAQATCASKPISDLVDAQGNQYVDCVMEGGGVLGIALVGYTYVLERVGVRFLSIGGTSAGAINATLLAGVADPADSKTDKILPMLAELEMFSFVDGDGDARDFVKALVKKAGPIKLGWKAWQVIDNLREDYGLNPGKVFENWLEDQLYSCGVKTTADLKKRMATLPTLQKRGEGDINMAGLKTQLKVITAEVTTRSKITFPEMADLFWDQPDAVSPARYVRCSMSIPYFFWPYTIDGLPQGDAAAAAWKKRTGFDGGAPKEAVFVDGGILSNFPINQFHVRNRVPRAPTLGIKLDNDRDEVSPVDGPLSLFGGIFNSARQCLDLDFFLRNPDYKQLVGTIATGATSAVGTGEFKKGHNWLDFFLKDAAKIDLFVRGAQAAAQFLAKFDWNAYKETRAQLLKATPAGAAPAPVAG